jgi:hypothetical protein
MPTLLLDYAERLALWCVGAVALLAGMAGLLALPFGALLLKIRKVWPSSDPSAEFLILAPCLLAVGGGALAYAAYVERYRRRPLPTPVIPVASRNTLVLVTLVVLPGPALAVIPFLYRWLVGLATQAGSPGGELSMLLAPIWIAVLMPAASLVASAIALAVAGPAGLLVYLGGSRRTGRILLLFWLLQLLLLMSSVPIILQGKSPDVQGEAIGFISYLLCAVFLGYTVPLFMLMQEPRFEDAAATAQFPNQQVLERFHRQPAAPLLAEMSIPQNSFLVRKTGGWKRLVKIVPPVFVVSSPVYNTSGPCLFKASAEGGLPLETFLVESKDGHLCRIRRRTVLLNTIGYAVENAQSGQILFELNRLSADGVDWAVADWRQQILGTLSLRQSNLSGIDFDLIVGGVPCVRYFWRMNGLLPEVSAEWQDPVPPGFHPLLAVAVGVVLAHFLPEGLPRSWYWWR